MMKYYMIIYVLLYWNALSNALLMKPHHHGLKLSSTAYHSLNIHRISSYYYINNDIITSLSMISSSSTTSSLISSSHFYSKKSYDDFKLSKYTSMVVKHLQLDRPSRIQALSYAPVVNGSSCIIADQTGSGKTLAYLLPVIERLYARSSSSSPPPSSLSSSPSSSKKKVICPKILIMAPTAELASQVSKVVKSISSVLRFRSICLTSGTKNLQDEIQHLKSSSPSSSSSSSSSYDDMIAVDILIATPGRLFSSLKNDEISLHHASSIILDEADVLFLDESFPLQGIGSYLPTNTATQFIFVTATLPDVTAKQIMKEFPNTVTIRGPGLHRIPPTIDEVLVDCSLKNYSPQQLQEMSQRQYNDQVLDSKRAQLLNALMMNHHVERTLIFCNTIDTCRYVENSLMRNDRNAQVRKVLSYHSAIDMKTRNENLNEFTRKLLPQPVVLICTDRASRGIDFAAFNVDHVILFDFPQEPSEYVRRVGRTGRAGRFGKVTILVHGRQLSMVKSLLSASKLGKRIDPIPSMSALQSYSKRDADGDEE